MGEPFLSEIRIFAITNAPPKGWALCNGQLLQINQNQPLFSLLGTVYGGNGQTTFGLPDLRGRVPIHFGSGHTLGERAGEQAHTLTISEMPTHNHPVNVYDNSNVDSNATSPAGAFYARTADASTLYSSGNANNAMNAGVIGNAGGSQAHENRQPFLALNFCIALVGIFPSPN
jgi:microcystin-dependent protein